MSTYYIITLILLLTQLSNLPVEGAANRPPVEGQPGQAVMAHCVTAEQKARNLVPLEREDVLTHATLQHLQMNARLDRLPEIIKKNLTADTDFTLCVK